MNSMRMRFPGGRARALTLSYDDGVEQDVRLIDIMRKFGVKGTFNLNSALFAPAGKRWPEGEIHRRMSAEMCEKAYRGNDVEVAVHAASHPFLDSLPSAAAAYEVLRDRAELEKRFRRIVRGMAYPYGTYSDGVTQVLRAAGIAYARTVKANMDFSVPNDWLRMGATCHHSAPELMELSERFLSDTVTGDAYLFYLWGHAYEFEMNDDWHVIENFLRTAGGRDDVWYATNIEVYDYVTAYRQIKSSLDLSILHNPSAVDVFLAIDGKPLCVPAGQTVFL